MSEFKRESLVRIEKLEAELAALKQPRQLTDKECSELSQRILACNPDSRWFVRVSTHEAIRQWFAGLPR